MAGDWIKMTKEVGDTPEVRKMLRLLRNKCNSRFDVVGRLHAVWSWADTHSLAGEDMPVTSEDIDDVAEVDGFAGAMRSVGWLAGEEESLVFPNFSRHNGSTAKARAESNRRMAKSRANRNTAATPVAPATQQNAQPEKSRVEFEFDSTTNQYGGGVVQAARNPGEVRGVMQKVSPCPQGGELVRCAESFYDELSAVGWRNKRGVALEDWRPLARKYARNWALNNTAGAGVRGKAAAPVHAGGRAAVPVGGARKAGVRMGSDGMEVERL